MITVSLKSGCGTGTRGDETQRIARARNQSVRIHRQLSRMRGLFHRLEHRVAGPLPELSAPMQSLAQKIDAFDHAVADIHDRAPAPAGKDGRPHGRTDQPPPADRCRFKWRGDPAADIGHRLLRHEHQRPTIPGNRRRTYVMPLPSRRRPVPSPIGRCSNCARSDRHQCYRRNINLLQLFESPRPETSGLFPLIAPQRCFADRGSPMIAAKQMGGTRWPTKHVPRIRLRPGRVKPVMSLRISCCSPDASCSAGFSCAAASARSPTSPPMAAGFFRARPDAADASHIAVPFEFFGGIALILALATRYLVIGFNNLHSGRISFPSHAYWTFTDAAMRRIRHSLLLEEHLRMPGRLPLVGFRRPRPPADSSIASVALGRKN